MPFLKKLNRTRSYSHVQRSKAKRFKRSLTLNQRLNMPMVVKQWCDDNIAMMDGMTSAGSGIDVMKAVQFSLNQIPQSATFASLFDQYRILQVEFKIYPRTSITSTILANQGTLADNFSRRLIYAVDNDDANTPASYNEVREYGKAKEIILSNGRTHTIKFRPSVATAVFQNGVAYGYSQKQAPWLDIANISVPHYGIKLALKGTNNANESTVDFACRFTLEFRNVR